MTEENIIRKHYGIKRRLSKKEIEDEKKNLVRKKSKGSLDDLDYKLAAKLKII